MANNGSSIILVHGVGGDAVRTWTHEETGTFWPTELLAEELPRCGVMSYSYRPTRDDFFPKTAEPSEDRTMERIDKHTSDLHYSLLDRAYVRLPPSVLPPFGEEETADRRTQTSRPFILVGHCLGGLVCLRYYFEYARVRGSCRGILLLATPLAPAEDASFWTKMVSSLGRAFKPILTPSSGIAIIRAAIMDCERELLAHNYGTPLVALFAEKQTDNCLVPRQYAGVGQALVTTLDEDHASLCTFADRYDSGWVAVQETLQQWCRPLERDRFRTPNVRGMGR